MLRHLLLATASALCLCPDGPVPDPDPDWQFTVTRADVERLLAEAREQPLALTSAFGGEYPLLCWQPECSLENHAAGHLDCWDPAHVPAAAQQPPDKDKFDPEKYEYPFPEGESEAYIKMMKDADAKRIEASRKMPQLDLYEESNAMYEAAAKTSNKSAYPWYRVAQNCQAVLEYKLGMDAIKQALKIDPKHPALITEKADLQRWARDRREALQTYAQAIEIDPKYVNAYLSRAQLYMQQHKWDEAQADVKKAKELEPHHPGVEGLQKHIDSALDNMGFTGDEIVVKTSKHYKIFCNDKGLANIVSAHAEAIFSYYTSLWPKPVLGGQKFSVFLFKDMKSYFKSGAPRNSGGYYSPLVRKLVLPVSSRDAQMRNAWQPGQKPDDNKLKNTLLVLYHEGFHQFLHDALEKAPQWFNEGHGDFYGGARWDPRKKRPKGGGLGYFNIGLNDWRTGTITAARMFTAERYKEPQRLMQMTQGEMYIRSQAGMNYAQAWSLVHFLHTNKVWGQQLLVPYYKELRKGWGLRNAFDKTFGRVDMAKFESQWVAFGKAKQK